MEVEETNFLKLLKMSLNFADADNVNLEEAKIFVKAVDPEDKDVLTVRSGFAIYLIQICLQAIDSDELELASEALEKAQKLSRDTQEVSQLCDRFGVNLAIRQEIYECMREWKNYFSS